jgi:type VI secretion system secreted protein Hcp
MAVKGEIFITANGSEVEGARENNSSLIFEFNHKVHLPFDRGMHIVQGHRRVSAFSVVKDIDKMTPQLYKIVDNGEICEILVKLYRLSMDTGEEEEYFNYSLEHSRIVSVENWMPSTKIEANENIGHLEKIEILAGVFKCTYLDGGIEHEIRSFDRT